MLLLLAWLLTPQCTDDFLRYDPVTDTDLAAYDLTFDGNFLAQVPPSVTSYQIGCHAPGQVCIRARDLSGNVGPQSCIPWELDPGMLLDVSDEGCAVGEIQACILHRPDGSCAASIAVPPACLTMGAR